MTKLYYWLGVSPMPNPHGVLKRFRCDSGLPFPTPVGTVVEVKALDNDLEVMNYEHHENDFRINLDYVHSPDFDEVCAELVQSGWEEM